MANIKQIIKESIQGYSLPEKKSCSCGCNSCGDKKKKLNEAKERVKSIVLKLNENQEKESYSIMKSKNLDFGDEFEFMGKAHPGHIEPIKLRGFITLDSPGSEPMIKVLGYGGYNSLSSIKDQVIKKLGKKYKQTQWGDMEDKDPLNEETTTFLYKLEGILVTSTHERNQTDILSDIRSISGVTIVSSKEYNPDIIATDSDNYQVYLTVKIDPHPFIGKGGFGKEELKLIYNEIKRVIGVKAFRLKKKPTRINEDEKYESQNFGFWFRAGVRGEKEAEQAKQLLTQKGINFTPEGKFGIDFKGKGLKQDEIMQLMLNNNITKYVVYNHTNK